MNREDIIKLAREAGFVEEFEECANSVWVQDTEITEYIERYAALVAAAEREACAELCERMARRTDDIRSAALEVAAENIRERGKT